jgi:hypothetical protein
VAWRWWGDGRGGPGWVISGRDWGRRYTNGKISSGWGHGFRPWMQIRGLFLDCGIASSIEMLRAWTDLAGMGQRRERWLPTDRQGSDVQDREKW